MDKSDLKQIIANQFQINSLLGLIDKKTKSGKLAELVDQFKDLKKIDLKNHSLYNQFTMISSLYVFIALPKEVIWDSIPETKKINELNEKWGFKNGWKIKNIEISDLKFRYLIRRLRNGINHANVTCSEKLNFTITDIDRHNESDKIDFEIEFSALDKFSRALGFWIMTDDIELNEL